MQTCYWDAPLPSTVIDTPVGFNDGSCPLLLGGPFAIDRHSREVVQNIYMRRVEDVSGEKQNVEFETFDNVRDPNNSHRER